MMMARPILKKSDDIGEGPTRRLIFERQFGWHRNICKLMTKPCQPPRLACDACRGPLLHTSMYAQQRWVLDIYLRIHASSSSWLISHTPQFSGAFLKRKMEENFPLCCWPGPVIDKIEILCLYFKVGGKSDLLPRPAGLGQRRNIRP